MGRSYRKIPMRSYKMKSKSRRRKSKRRKSKRRKSKRRKSKRSVRTKKGRKRRYRKHRMDPPGYGENFPPPYSAASQIEEHLTTIATLQNKVTSLEDLLERSQESFDKRISDLNIYNQQLEATVFYYQNSGGGRVVGRGRVGGGGGFGGGQGVARLPGLQLSPQDIAEMNAEAGSDLDRETSSDSDDPNSDLHPVSPRYDP